MKLKTKRGISLEGTYCCISLPFAVFSSFLLCVSPSALCSISSNIFSFLHMLINSHTTFCRYFYILFLIFCFCFFFIIFLGRFLCCLPFLSFFLFFFYLFLCFIFTFPFLFPCLLRYIFSFTLAALPCSFSTCFLLFSPI